MVSARRRGEEALAINFLTFLDGFLALLKDL